MSTIVIALKHLKFPLGQIVITANAEATLDPDDVQEALSRHASGDWGDIPPEDAEQNAFGLSQGERLFSAYGKDERLFSAYGKDESRFWIITERDRSVTTVLLPLDY
jgi:hypothetical protein